MSDWHVSFLLSSLSALCRCLPLFSGMFCLVGFLQGGIEDTEMFYILQMTCDHNCTAEGSCCDELRDHPALSVGAACWLWLNCIVLLDWCCATLFLLNLWPDLESHEGQENLLHVPCVNYSSILTTLFKPSVVIRTPLCIYPPWNSYYLMFR